VAYPTTITWCSNELNAKESLLGSGGKGIGRESGGEEQRQR
jgi:hypothetical protein